MLAKISLYCILKGKQQPKKSFDDFWDIAKRKIEIHQAAAVDDCRHAQVTKDGDVGSNFTLAIFVRDLCEQCCNPVK